MIHSNPQHNYIANTNEAWGAMMETTGYNSASSVDEEFLPLSGSVVEMQDDQNRNLDPTRIRFDYYDGSDV